MTHRIQLRSPWEFRWLSAPPAGQPESGRCPLPLDWQSAWGDSCGTVACHRWFHRPTNLDPHESVWLIAEGIRRGVRVCLNGELLAQFADQESTVNLDLTGRLLVRNQLTVELAVDSGRPVPAGIAGPVYLEIRSKPGPGSAQAASADDVQTAE